MRLGQENSRTTKREPCCQSSKQDQDGEVSRSGYGEGRETQGFEEERPGREVGEGKRPESESKTPCWLNIEIEERGIQDSSREEREEVAKGSRI